jgi:hypothetical protein
MIGTRNGLAPRTLQKTMNGCTLEDCTLFSLLGLLTACRKGRPWGIRLCRCLVFVADGHCNGLVEDFLYTVLLFAAAFHVESTHLPGYSTTLLGGYGCEALCLEQLDTVLLVPQIRFEAKEHEGRRGAEVEDFGVPLVKSVGACGMLAGESYLVHDVFERIRTVNGEAHEDDVCLGV